MSESKRPRSAVSIVVLGAFAGSALVLGAVVLWRGCGASASGESAAPPITSTERDASRNAVLEHGGSADTRSAPLPIDVRLPSPVNESAILTSGPPPLRAIHFVRAEDGLPVASGEVRALDSDGSVASVGPLVAHLRLDGTYEQPNLPDHEWTRFVLLAEGRSPLVFRCVEGADRMVIPVEAAATLRIELTDRRASLGVGLQLIATTSTSQLVATAQRADLGPDESIMSWSADLRADEPCQLAALPAHVPLSLRVVEAGRDVHVHGEALVLASGETRDLSIELLGPGPALVVRAVDERGAPYVDRTVGILNRGVDALPGDTRALLLSNGTPAFRETAHTDEQGFARFEHVPPGRWWVGLAPARAPWDSPHTDVPAPLAELIEIGASEERREHELVSPRGAYIRGRVEFEELDGDAAGAHRRRSVILIAQGIGIGGGVTGDPAGDGEFWVGPVTNDAYRLETFAAGWAPIEPLTVRASDPPIVLRLRAGARVSGRVIDPTTRAGVRAEVVLSMVGETGTEQLGSSGGDGGFDYSGVPDGACVVAAFTPDGRGGASRVVQVRNGVVVEGLEVELAPSARSTELRVTLEGAIDPGRLIVAAGGASRAYAFVDGPGSHVFACPPGEVDVRLYAATKCIERRRVTLDAAPLEVRIRR